MAWLLFGAVRYCRRYVETAILHRASPARSPLLPGGPGDTEEPTAPQRSEETAPGDRSQETARGYRIHDTHQENRSHQENQDRRSDESTQTDHEESYQERRGSGPYRRPAASGTTSQVPQGTDYNGMIWLGPYSEVYHTFHSCPYVRVGLDQRSGWKMMRQCLTCSRMRVE